MKHPYSNKPDYCFWSKAMTWIQPGHIDPAVNTRFKIEKTDKVATIGSCFAQHISKFLKNEGFNYFVTEKAPREMEEDIARKKQYETFSARYGNVYTVRQALQLIRRSLGQLATPKEVWRLNGGFVDPFRPSVEPEGFASYDELIKDRERHLKAAATVFTDCDFLLFTLGLTESWLSRGSGLVYPLAPGVHGGEYNPQEYLYHNFSIYEVIEDLSNFCSKFHQCNPNGKIILTVSPVAMAATFEDRHVLVSNTYMKSVLRVAAEEVEKIYNFVEYFPSFEIINGPHHSGRYIEADLRQVTDIGVNHVMRVFKKHYMAGMQQAYASEPLGGFVAGIDDILCDEDSLVNLNSGNVTKKD